MPTVQTLQAASLQALRRAGVPEPQALTQLSVLLEAELRGVASHGLLRLPRIIERIRHGVTDPVTRGTGAWRREALWQVDGCQGLGPVVAVEALERVCDKAQETGVAIAAVRNSDHLGMLAWYAEHVAARGKILIALTISEALVHPWGGRQAMLGTNPIALGIPTGDAPFVFDMATSLVSMGKIHDHASRDLPIPDGWALDSEGNPTNDAHAAKQGAIAPFGGAKGYGLALAFELLVVSLTESAIGRDVKGTLDSTELCNKGDVFIVIEPTAHAGQRLSQFLTLLRQSPPADPSQPVRVPGDRAQRVRVAQLDKDIALPAPLWARIQELAGQDPHATGTLQTNTIEER
ncbi:Ldh family oxidoreductase [Bordetella sp. 15P40C-2]|uniref:Ldh family oxidoreductase n=1 Tax=Bordetella sp. 15P40C-2 TaxID=2572246 RepID=UPI0013291DCF|nr:Ldh family oxidoreductase [Bordetella sp. 15P40C-2]MVW70711.1 Ldh family oxidoreductase [Bordetella sp. 15P40C-2]